MLDFLALNDSECLAKSMRRRIIAKVKGALMAKTGKNCLGRSEKSERREVKARVSSGTSENRGRMLLTLLRYVFDFVRRRKFYSYVLDRHSCQAGEAKGRKEAGSSSEQ